MKFTINREVFLEKLTLASHFTSTKLTSSLTLQGVLLKGIKNILHFYSSNLSSYLHTSLKVDLEKETEIVIEPKKLIEYINFLPPGKLEIEVKEKQITIVSGKTKGNFPLIAKEDFPLPPKIEEKEQTIKTDFLLKNLPMVLFSASYDETRPVLTGVNFLTQETLIIVSTDGFRLSLVKVKKEIDIPSVIIPADFLSEILQFVKEEKEVKFSYLKKEKMIVFSLDNTEFYSRLIEGDFPPFEKVIPTEKRTTVTIDADDFLRNIKLISVFARDFSNIVILQMAKDGIWIKPKTDAGDENNAFQEAELEGEEQKVAFNYKFLLDFLNHSKSKKIIIEVLRPDAPVVFKMGESDHFLHIIMPVRIQE